MAYMAVDKRGRKLPKGIMQRYEGFEGRVMYKGKRHLVHGNTITETQKKIIDLKYKLGHGLFLGSDKTTLDNWFQTWLTEYKQNQVKRGTCIAYESYYNSVIKKRLGNQNIADIRGQHLQQFYNELVKAGYALSSIKIVATILNGCFKQALKNGMIERDPTKLAELPRQKGRTAREVMTKEQQGLFMEYAKESYLYNFFAVMLRTGLRGGELRGLRYSDIDKNKRVIRIQRTLKYETGYGYFEDTPKTRTSTRDIPLTAALEELLDTQHNYWGFKVVKMKQYLFCTEEGLPLGRRRIQGEIDRTIKRIQAAGYELNHITPHVFRHTFATRAIEAGMQPQVLKTILGHSSLAMTMDLYSHVLPDTKAEEMEKIAGAF